jgi:anti-sigma B factor antagonist/stage II sporulation protein AA (anti-sigma F factor antagonist)
MTFQLNINLDTVDKNIILRLDGRIDAVTTPILERKIHALLAEHHNRILLDFLHIDYLSSAGLRLLLATTKALKTKQGALILFSIDDEVMEIIKLAGFEKVLHIFANQAEAVRYTP